MDRKVVNAVQSMREHNRFIRGMTSWVGFKQTGVEYIRQERFAGRTKYPLRKMVRFAFDAITGFSYFPLQVTVYVSLVLALVAVCWQCRSSLSCDCQEVRYSLRDRRRRWSWSC